jgi:hypothetical protein
MTPSMPLQPMSGGQSGKVSIELPHLNAGVKPVNVYVRM